MNTSYRSYSRRFFLSRIVGIALLASVFVLGGWGYFKQFDSAPDFNNLFEEKKPTATFISQVSDAESGALPGVSPVKPGMPTKTYGEKPTVYGRKFMIVTPHPYATFVGNEILRRGGTAVDAAIAAGAMLTLVEPSASGIGGGGYMMVYDAKTRKITSYDGRETAPASATEKMFLTQSGKPQEFFSAVVGGKSVGVPGLVKMFEDAHLAHGKTSWFELWQPTANAAKRGFPVSKQLHAHLARETYLRQLPEARKYFYDPAGEPWEAGHILQNPALVETIHRIAVNGSKEFYEGLTTNHIIEAVKKSQVNPALMSIKDFLDYTSKEQPPVCGTYRGYKICGMAPSSGGGIVTLQTLAMLEKFSLSTMQPDGPEAVHLVAEASALAYADRDRYLADPAFVPYKQTALLDKRYVDKRAKLISTEKTFGTAKAGAPFGNKVAMGETNQVEPVSTSHLSVVDQYGNAVSLTTSIENYFGSRLFVDGFLLNNELTDFSFTHTDGDRKVANRVQPGKRPRSSMSPTFVFDKKGNLKMVLGSPGGPYITPFVVKTLVNVLDWKRPLPEAIAAPNFVDRNGPLELEARRFDHTTTAVLKTKGHQVIETNLVSGVNAIYIGDNGQLTGVADGRLEGQAAGQ